MSTYGGDSWVPEAMHRKRQVGHLLADVHNLDHDSSQVCRLSNGRLACLVCPHHPVLDSFPVLIIHRKSARHQAAAAKLEEKELQLYNEVQKRTALAANDRTMPTNSGTLQHRKPLSAAASSPLVESTRKRTAKALAVPGVSHLACEQGTREATNQKQKVGRGEALFFSPKLTKSPAFSVAESSGFLAGNTNTQQSGLVNMQIEQAILVSTVPVCLKEDKSWQKERERQLRLREAGWRLDGNGKWFKEENTQYEDIDGSMREVIEARVYLEFDSSGALMRCKTLKKK